MTAAITSSVVSLDTSLLVPLAWQTTAAIGPVYAFNPAIIIHRGARLCAYRIVLADGRRRIAVVRMDAAWRPVPGTAVPLSDFIAGAPLWQADPRFFAEGDRLWIHFNSGIDVPNCLSVVELAPETLTPVGPAVPIHKRRGRQTVEKNWMFFDDAGQLRAVYQVSPHQVLGCLRGAHRWIASPLAESRWDAAAAVAVFGTLRGGTPPVRVGDRYVSFFHGRRLRGLGPRMWSAVQGRSGRWDYSVGAYTFDAVPPYAPRAISALPVITASSARVLPPLNRWAFRVAYPCGAVLEDGQWVVSFGENDERCCLATIEHTKLLAGLRPIGEAR